MRACVQVDAHPVVAEFNPGPLSHAPVDGLDESFVVGDGGLAPQPEPTVRGFLSFGKLSVT